MSPEEKQRMVHIRLDSEVHRELRKAAAEYDITIQEIVSDAVEKRVENFDAEIRLERRQEELEKKAEEYELNITGTIDTEYDSIVDRDSGRDASLIAFSLMGEQLNAIETAIRSLSEQIVELKSLLVSNE